MLGFCMVVLAGSLVGGIVFGAKTILNALFFANSDYAVKTVEVTTDGTLARDAILKTAAVAEGINIFSVDLPRIQQRLNALPQVEDCNVQRQLPDRVAITIQERRPVALLVPPDKNTGSVNFENASLMDHRGILLKPKSLAPEYYALPAIVGVDASNYVPGQAIDRDEVKAALELIRLSSEILPSRLQIQSIDVSKGYCLVVTDKQRESITFGTDQIESQLRKLESVFNHCDHNNKELQTVNLMLERNVPVKFVDTAAPDPAVAGNGLSNHSINHSNNALSSDQPQPSREIAKRKFRKVPKKTKNSTEHKKPRKKSSLRKFRLHG
jgi:cell division protein FtsQ